MANTYTALTAENKTFYDKVLLKRLIPELMYTSYGQKKSLKKNDGDKINFRKFNSYAAATTPLTEGVTPTGKTISMSTVEATVNQYGDYTETTDKIDMVAMDPVVTEITEVHGEQAALTIDTVVKDIIAAGTNVLYANGTSTAEVGAANVFTSTIARKAVRALRRANAKPLEGGYFVAIVHPDVAFDLMNDSLWQDISKYNGGTAIMKGELGKIAGIRFVESTNAKVKAGAGATSSDVYCTMVIGKNAYAVVDVDGSVKPETIVKPLGSAGSADPLDQRATVGWKAMFTAARLDELSMIRVETGATA